MELDWDAMVLVGRIARPHGLRGEVVVNPDTDFAVQRFARGQILYVRRAGRVEGLRISTVRFQSGRPVVGLEGLTSITDIKALASNELRILPEALARLPVGTYYRHDLRGCNVVTTAGTSVGRVVDVEGQLQGGSRLVVGGERGDVLVPLAADICVEIDLAARRIVIAPPEGLLELNAPGVRSYR